MALTPTTQLTTHIIRKKMDCIRICIGLSSSYTKQSCMFNNITLGGWGRRRRCKVVSDDSLCFTSYRIPSLLGLSFRNCSIFFRLINSASLCTVTAFKENSENISKRNSVNLRGADRCSLIFLQM